MSRGALQRTILPLLLAGWSVLLGTTSAFADKAASLPSALEWDESGSRLLVSFGFRHLIDEAIRVKLTRGLPTTIVLTATAHQAGQAAPFASTAQTCKITWHVWEEAYRVEISRPGESVTGWTTTLQGVLRRCGEARRLLLATKAQLPRDTAVTLRAKLVVNPVSPEILQKLQRWVSRPTATGTAAPGDALFSTFAGLFLRRIGDAEREIEFDTLPSLPKRQLDQADGR